MEARAAARAQPQVKKRMGPKMLVVVHAAGDGEAGVETIAVLDLAAAARAHLVIAGDSNSQS